MDDVAVLIDAVAALDALRLGSGDRGPSMHARLSDEYMFACLTDG